MDKKTERIEKLIVSFKRELCKRDFGCVFDYLVEPGGIFVIERENIQGKDKMLDANAFIREAKKDKILRRQRPCWAIFLIKEEIAKMEDEDVLHTMAHELSHILMKRKAQKYPDLRILSEQACDILAEKFLGFPKKDRGQGYIH